MPLMLCCYEVCIVKDKKTVQNVHKVDICIFESENQKAHMVCRHSYMEQFHSG
jgi:hypothetical protein